MSVFFFVVSVCGSAYPQNNSDTNEAPEETTSWTETLDIVRRGIRVNLTDSGSSYAKFIFSTQFWARLIQTNPGSIDANTREPLNLYTDFAVRRARWILLANLENRLFLFSQIGITSFARNAQNRNPFYVHDFQGQIQYLPGQYFGAGLHLWTGLSRDSRIAHASYLTLDNEGYNIPNSLTVDWVGRQIGVFLRGMIGPFGYSLATNVSENANAKLSTDADIAQAAEDHVARLRRHSNFNLHGYGYWSFLNKDAPLTSGAWQMTYLGKKGRIFNLGAGFQYQPEDIGYWSEPEQEVKQQASLSISGDVFLEYPLPAHSLLNIYISYHIYDFGPNYVRTQNIMGGYAVSDPNQEPLLPGAGHTSFAWGTGHLLHGEIGYVLPRFLVGSVLQLQPFVGITWRDMKAFAEPTLNYRVGFNWYILDQGLKLTGEYAIRPLIGPTTRRVEEYLGLFVLQLQVRI